MSTTAPSSPALSVERRDELRARLVARIPRWYSPYLHLIVPSVIGLGLITTAILLLDHVRAWELALIPVFFLISNATEWRVHRDVLHKRQWFAPVLHDRHTPEHHVIFITDDMAMRSAREFRLVLVPAYGVLLLFGGTLPVAALLYFIGLPNIGLLFIAQAMLYTVTYEWLHLSYHLPADSRIGRSWLIRVLRRHHATHHNPALMQKWNFNVSLPLWDFLRGTIYKTPADQPAAHAKAATAEQPASP
jgi:Fatty acid hydroxylase superfamily